MTMSLERDSSSEESNPGAAQFLANLSPRQLQHLQYSVPKKEEPERYSVFLEEPREVPVPKRFTFDLNLLAQLSRANEEKHGAKHARKVSVQSRTSTTGSGSDGTASTRMSVDLLKEATAEKMEKVASVDWQFYATGVCLCVLNLVAAWDATTLSIALPTIATKLGGSTFETLWLGLAFLVAATCVLPLFATLSEILGRKAILLTALTFFAFGSFIAAVTGNFTGLLFGRTIQGIGAGGIYALSSLILSDLISDADRVKWGAFVGASWVLGAVTGPVLGGALVHNGQWRWIFWLNLPLCTLVFLFVAFFAQLRPAAPGPLFPKIRNVDWLGFILFSGSLVSLVLGLTWGGALHPWSDPRTILPIIFGLIGIPGFLVWSWFSPYPSLISLDGLSDPTTLAAYFGATVQGTIVFAVLYFLPLYFGIAKRTLSLTQIGVSLCAWSIPLAAFALLAFFVVTRTNMHRVMIWCGWFFVVIGVALMTILTRESATGMWLCIAVFSGIGMGLIYPSLASVAGSRTLSKDGDSAVTNLVFFQSLGQTLGVTIGSAIFQNQLYRDLLERPVLEKLAVRYASDAFALVEILRDLAKGDEEALKIQVADAYVASIRTIWIVMAALAGAALVASLLIKRRKEPRPSELEMRAVGDAYIV